MKTVYAIVSTLGGLLKAIRACPRGQVIVFDKSCAPASSPTRREDLMGRNITGHGFGKEAGAQED